MGDIDHYQALDDLCLRDHPLDLTGDIDHFIPCGCPDIDFLQHAGISHSFVPGVMNVTRVMRMFFPQSDVSAQSC
jgi:hypothetical protein